MEKSSLSTVSKWKNKSEKQSKAPLLGCAEVQFSGITVIFVCIHSLGLSELLMETRNGKVVWKWGLIAKTIAEVRCLWLNRPMSHSMSYFHLIRKSVSFSSHSLAHPHRASYTHPISKKHALQYISSIKYWFTVLWYIIYIPLMKAYYLLQKVYISIFRCLLSIYFWCIFISTFLKYKTICFHYLNK